MKLTRPISTTQRRCIIDATNAPLIGFRRGHAHSKSGPFYRRDTIENLLRRGVLRPLYPNSWGTRYLTALAVETPMTTPMRGPNSAPAAVDGEKS